MSNIGMSRHSLFFLGGGGNRFCVIGQHVSALNYVVFRILIFNKHIEENSMF